MMTTRKPGRYLWERMLIKFASSRPGSWFFSHTAHHIDGPMMRLSKGRVCFPGMLGGLPVLLITTTGAKSSKPRQLPLLYLTDGDNVVVIASYYGNPKHPAWYYNLKATPQAKLLINGKEKTYTAYQAEGEERERLWQKAVDTYAGYAAYQRRTAGRKIPVMVLTPVSN